MNVWAEVVVEFNQRDPMEFHIRSHIHHKGPSRFVASVMAIPAEGASPGAWEVLEKASPTKAEARAVLRELTVKMGEKIRASGGAIVTVETFD
jgi:hypothetical protein